MKLYYSPGACSLASHIALREAELPFEMARADTKTKKLEDGGDYLAVNPLGYVPLLQLDGGAGAITEGPAIMQYIADRAPEKKLAPAAGTPERIKLQSWLNFVATEVHKGFSPLFNPGMPEEAKAIFRERLASRFAHVDRHLADNDYLLGKAYSVADAYLFVITNWAAPTGVDLAPYPNILAYRKRVGARPAVKAALKAEGLTK